MLQRLFLAFTLAFPLYLSIAIQQTYPLADRVNRPSSRGINKIEQTLTLPALKRRGFLVHRDYLRKTELLLKK
ncbi:MAG: hypothetical protein GPJ12_23885 [Microcystis aeruginosa S11-01]|jgi:hypothetical protein|nr:hypothetical protein [Microcystis aeruginosa S11-01]NCS46411.1 hypothetical protein [Microcystis aeruginosa BS11-05]NCS55307.1 hypothetical protein [Microcystis aeruginosa G13-05]